LPITGSATTTLGAVSLSATGALPITGSASVTLGAVTLSASGAELVILALIYGSIRGVRGSGSVRGVRSTGEIRSN
jgi:hypothetical protein